jgi:hypothetical protein
MAYTTIDDPSAHFHTRLYSGNNSGSGLAVTNNANAGDFQPDWVWIKRRDSAGSSGLHDSNRGSTKRLKSDSTDAEDTNSNILASFDSNGFTIGDNSGNYNASGTYVAWQWKCNGGTTSSNTDGDITATVQTNSTAGFSIITYTGNGNNLDTIGHGLGATPDFAVVKGRTGDNTKRWFVKIPAVCGNSEILEWDTNNAKQDSGNGIETMGSSTITLGIDTGNINSTNENTKTYVCYAFKSIQGYSKIGSYTGNGNADGAFVYTGFKPAWLMIKRTDSANHWLLFDIKRDTINVGEKWLRADTNDAASTGIYWDGLSNGFKARTNDPIINASGGTYVYMTFAEHPFVSSKGVPVTAR